jgi:hypothetical protein
MCWSRNDVLGRVGSPIAAYMPFITQHPQAQVSFVIAIADLSCSHVMDALTNTCSPCALTDMGVHTMQMTFPADDLVRIQGTYADTR